MTKHAVWYSVQNGGDGSAYPMFLSSQRLAEWDQSHMDEGWGESCTGSLIVEAEGEVNFPEMLDEVGYWLHRTEDEHYEPWDLRDEYLWDFFSDGLPTFEVRIRSGAPYYDIFVDGVKKGECFGYNHDTNKSETTEAERLKLERRLNR